MVATLPRWTHLVSLAVVSLLGLAPAASLGQEGTPVAEEAALGMEIVAGGLTNPRGFTWGEDGTLYVTLAGTGGPNLPTEFAEITETFGGFFGGTSAAVVRIEDGCPVTVADGLPSYVDGSGAVAGVSDVAILGGQLYATVDGGGTVHGNPDHPVGLYRINADGSWEVVADLSAWLRANRVAEPPPPPDDDPDGEVWQLLPTADGSAFWVIETNQEQLLRITLTGEVTRVADLSARLAVPTGLAPAPDGGVYVGNLTPFPFLDGTAEVIHIAADGTVTDQWSGLTAIVAMAVGPDGALYALEMATGADENAFLLPDSGRIVRQTGPDTLEVVAAGLNLPIGLDFGPDGALYVGSPALGAAAGTAVIARLDMSGEAIGDVPEPAPCFVAPAV